MQAELCSVSCTSPHQHHLLQWGWQCGSPYWHKVLSTWKDKYLSQFPSGLISLGHRHSRPKCKGHVKNKPGKNLPGLIPSLDTSSPPGNNTTGYSNKWQRGNSNVSSCMKVKPYSHTHTLTWSLPVESVSTDKNESLCIDAYQKNNIFGCHKKQLQITFFICPIFKTWLNLDREIEWSDPMLYLNKWKWFQ